MRLAVVGGGGFRTPHVWQALLHDTGDIQAHGAGAAYPTTPGHFEEVACQP